MNKDTLEAAIQARGHAFFDAIGDETPSVFNKSWWTGKVMDACMHNDEFKIQLFRFIDVLPYLTTGPSLGRHIREYFSRGEGIPSVLKWGIKGMGLGGRVAMKLVGGTLRKNIEMMARDFIVGATVPETVKRLRKVRDDGFAFTLDLLGEATVSETEADRYAQGYLEMLDGLEAAQADWPAIDADGDLDWGHAPRVNVSLKPSALYSQSTPADVDRSVGHILERLKPITRKVVGMGGFLCIDSEMRRLREITQELYRRLRGDAEFRDYPHLGLAVQVYLREADRDIQRLLDWARAETLPISIRLVKGAYWDYETVIARQHGWPDPLYTVKAQTDAAFERAAAHLLCHHDVCHLSCASHNVRSVSTVIETARALGVPEDRYEFQVLYGMAEPFRKALRRMVGRVRLYAPFGEMLPGMAYLMRRLLENTSNESFLRQTFVEGVERERLLESPERTAAQALAAGAAPAASTAAAPAPDAADLPPFRNDPFPDWTQPQARDPYRRAIDAIRTQLGKTYPLLIGGREVTTDERIESVNPARPDEVIGRVCQAGPAEVEAAIAAAGDAFPAWRDTAPRARAEHLLRAADAARRRLYDLAAWQTLEGGKQWSEAYLDVAEAIDFLEYYAREMIRLGPPRRLGSLPGEMNEQFYQPKGLAAVIAPWNFPLAISCGMCAAAIVAGNPTVYKPSNQTPVIGYTLAQLFAEAGLPPGVFNYVPGRGSVIGDLLVEHPRIALIAFTGSMEVGLGIIERAGRTPEGQAAVKKVIAEMGGKNAIIVDDDADLDEAVPAVLYSAFGYQGQKCSACSRVIVLDAIYDRFMERLVEAARSLRIGPAEDPGNYLGPVVDASAQASIRRYIQIATEEGTVVFQGNVPDTGFYVRPTIVTGITPECRIAQEEVFGPVLAVMRARDMDEALAWANATRFALTGGVFSRSPDHLERCRREFRVGNLYINRGCTGALVGRQPFGGFRMSGTGTKAGGTDYLLHFMDPRVVSENTMRRGFVPEAEILGPDGGQAPGGRPPATTARQASRQDTKTPRPAPP